VHGTAIQASSTRANKTNWNLGNSNSNVMGVTPRHENYFFRWKIAPMTFPLCRAAHLCAPTTARMLI
jgi:hypothetical protein